MLQRFLLLWLTLLSLLAFRWTADFDPFVESKPWLGALIVVTMFCIGSLLPRDEVQQVLHRWPTVLGGTVIQYSTMPVLAFALAHAFRLEAQMLTGVILVGCVPGAMASNVLTLAARGNVSYSVSLTTAATLLSPLMVPLWLWLTLGADRRLDLVDVGVRLVVQVVLPVVGGHLLSRNWPAFQSAMRTWGPRLANGAILWIIAIVVGLNRERLGMVEATVLTTLLLVNCLGYAAGYLGARLLQLNSPMRKALTLEVGMQNAGLGTILALQLFPDSPETAIPTAAYTFGCMLTGTVLAQYWSRRKNGESVVT